MEHRLRGRRPTQATHPHKGEEVVCWDGKRKSKDGCTGRRDRFGWPHDGLRAPTARRSRPAREAPLLRYLDGSLCNTRTRKSMFAFQEAVYKG
jgi:hypothetical protein